jgi:hypothetical protein
MAKIPLGDKRKKGQCGPNCAVTYFDFYSDWLLGSEEHAVNSSSLDKVHSLREKAVREDIASRLGHICSDFSPDEFKKLVSLMAARQVKCERRATW